MFTHSSGLEYVRCQTHISFNVPLLHRIFIMKKQTTCFKIYIDRIRQWFPVHIAYHTTYMRGDSISSQLSLWFNLKLLPVVVLVNVSDS